MPDENSSNQKHYAMSNLAKLTKSQLVADYPKLDLKMSMTKDQMIEKINSQSSAPKAAKQGRNGEY